MCVCVRWGARSLANDSSDYEKKKKKKKKAKENLYTEYDDEILFSLRSLSFVHPQLRWICETHKNKINLFFLSLYFEKISHAIAKANEANVQIEEE